jgi:20S proteasome subunit alpha 3
MDRNIAAAVAGITADANILINTARLHAQRYQLQYCEMIPVELLAERLCDVKQGYTQYGGINFIIETGITNTII